MRTLTELVSEVEDIMFLSEEYVERAVKSMILRTKIYVETNRLESLVIGVSGGLDSATVAAILTEDNIGVPLIGLSIPMNSSIDHKERACWVGNNYCSAFEEFDGWETRNNEIPSDQMYQTVIQTLQDTDGLAVQVGFNPIKFPQHILQGNAKARLRMMTLYDLARKTNGMVLSTDNLSEYLAGFWTINGDVGDWGIIQNIWKGFELPQIAKYVGVRDDIITQKPSDGLSVTVDDSDEAQLGMNYKEFDTIISIQTGHIDVHEEKYHQLSKELDLIREVDDEDGAKVNAAIQRYASTHHKRTGTINLTREQLGFGF